MKNLKKKKIKLGAKKLIRALKLELTSRGYRPVFLTKSESKHRASLARRKIRLVYINLGRPPAKNLIPEVVDNVRIIGWDKWISRIHLYKGSADVLDDDIDWPDDEGEEGGEEFPDEIIDPGKISDFCKEVDTKWGRMELSTIPISETKGKKISIKTKAK